METITFEIGVQSKEAYELVLFAENHRQLYESLYAIYGEHINCESNEPERVLQTKLRPFLNATIKAYRAEIKGDDIFPDLTQEQSDDFFEYFINYFKNWKMDNGILTTVEQVLKACSIEGNVVKLPQTTLPRNLYVDVKKQLELINGKWTGGKTQGFVFPNDPSELLEQIANGEKRNLKKEFQFFETNAKLADRLVELAEIKRGNNILEPSAGQGAIIKAINKVSDEVVDYYELMPTNRTILEQKIDDGVFKAQCVGSDFLEADGRYQYDRIIANPPFSSNQDILHIRKMYEQLRTGGRLVSIASKHWQLSNNKVETEFREWLNKVDAKIEEVPAGEFKESGTTIATVIIVINKK